MAAGPMGEVFGRYQLRRRLGVGGMAEVYEAIAYAEHGIEKPLVIKRILEEFTADPTFRDMFIDEARIAMRLNHPNVVQVFDFGKADDRYFLAMELVRGKDLGAALSRAKQSERTIPAGVAIFVVGEAAKGLDHAHRMTGSDGRPLGIVHRDVSPQNILISAEGSVKIGDFGIAKFDTRKGKTQAASVRGKVRYMSPEQADGGSIDARSDLFALGAVLYEMLTGRPAFDGQTDLAVLDQVRRGTPPRPSELVPIPAELERIVLKAMARDPRARHARGTDLQRELEQFAVAQGLRASSSALSEFLNALFPEMVRVSDAHSETQIKRIAALEEKQRDRETGNRRNLEITNIRRLVEQDGMPVFVSEEVKTEATPVTRGKPRRPPPSTGVREYDLREPKPPEVSVSVSVTNAEGTASSATAESKVGEDSRPGEATAPPMETVPSFRGPIGAVTARSPAPAPSSDTAPVRTAPPRKSPAPTPRPAPPPPPPVPKQRLSDMMELPSDIGLPVMTQKAAAPMVMPPQQVDQLARTPRPGATTMPMVIAAVVLGAGVLWIGLKWTSLGRMAIGPADGETPVVEQTQSSTDPGDADPAHSFGLLVITGDAGDEITIDGNLKGSLPHEPFPLTIGLHEVSVVGKDGFTSTFGADVLANKKVIREITRPKP